ncbi:MAG TPA: hypothetical protein VF903_01085 [Nitrospirota bacterium]
MGLTTRHKQTAFPAVLFAFFILALTQGCGVNGGPDARFCDSAPQGSTITITSLGPSSFSTATILYWNVQVQYPDKTAMPYACLYFKGGLASPNPGAYYQFYSSSGLPQNNGFRDRTDEFGGYNFTTQLLSGGTVTPAPDKIIIESSSIVFTSASIN